MEQREVHQSILDIQGEVERLNRLKLNAVILNKQMREEATEGFFSLKQEGHHYDIYLSGGHITVRTTRPNGDFTTTINGILLAIREFYDAQPQ